MVVDMATCREDVVGGIVDDHLLGIVDTLRSCNLLTEVGIHVGKERLGIEADISLAPFDLGIFQKFRMYSQEFEINGIDEVVVDLRRIGGTPDSWVRSNRAFASELREQFLLWRSLPIGTIEHYRSETKKTLGLS